MCQNEITEFVEPDSLANHIARVLVVALQDGVFNLQAGAQVTHCPSFIRLMQRLAVLI